MTSMLDGYLAQIDDTQLAEKIRGAIDKAMPRVLPATARSQETFADRAAQLRHLYSGPDGLYPDKLSALETEVLAAEINMPTLLGWYRDPAGGLSVA